MGELFHGAVVIRNDATGRALLSCGRRGPPSSHRREHYSTTLESHSVVNHPLGGKRFTLSLGRGLG